MALEIVPLSPRPQRLRVELADITYSMLIKWCGPAQAWVLDVADADGNDLASGLALVTGENVLDGLAYLGIGGSLYVATDGDYDAVPTFENLGVDGKLYFIPAES